jgi:hypothetical protein
MTLEELLDELRRNVLHDVSNLNAGPSDHYWSDESLVRYINDAQRRFARRTLCIRDKSTPEVVETPLEDGIDEYTLHSAVLAVLSARYELHTYDLPRTTHVALSGARYPETSYFDVNSYAGTGAPQLFTTDEAIDPDDPTFTVVHLRVWPTPTAAEDGKLLRLRVARLPLTEFTVDRYAVKCEIPEDYQLDMLEWAAYRALRNWDVDSEDRTKADMHKKRFDDAVFEARQELNRKMFSPAQWQFGHAGFSWEK